MAKHIMRSKFMRSIRKKRSTNKRSKFRLNKKTKKGGRKQKRTRKLRRKIQKGGEDEYNYADFWDGYCDKYRDELRDIYEYNHLLHNGLQYKTVFGKPGKLCVSDKYLEIYKKKFANFKKINQEIYEKTKKEEGPFKQSDVFEINDDDDETFLPETDTSETGLKTHDLNENMKALNENTNSCSVKPYCADPTNINIPVLPAPLGEINKTSLSAGIRNEIIEFTQKFDTELDDSKLLPKLLVLLHQKDDIDRRSKVTNKAPNDKNCRNKYNSKLVDIDKAEIQRKIYALLDTYESLDREKLNFHKTMPKGIENSEYFNFKFHGIFDTLTLIKLRLDELTGEINTLLPRNKPSASAYFDPSLGQGNANVNAYAQGRSNYDKLLSSVSAQYIEALPSRNRSETYLEAEPSGTPNPYFEPRAKKHGPQDMGYVDPNASYLETVSNNPAGTYMDMGNINRNNTYMSAEELSGEAVFGGGKSKKKQTRRSKHSKVLKRGGGGGG